MTKQNKGLAVQVDTVLLTGASRCTVSISIYLRAPYELK